MNIMTSIRWITPILRRHVEQLVPYPGREMGGCQMKKWNMVIDVALCHDCNNCFLADKDEFVGNDFPGYSAAQPWAGRAG